MRTPSLFAWLSGITSYHIIYPSSEEKNRALFQEALMKDAHYAQAPLVEVLPTTVSSFAGKFIADKINLEGGLTLLKGRVNGNVENFAGNFEGSLRLSKCAIELVNTLHYEIQDGQLSFRGKRVLELGCGHGLPGVFACLKGASVVHFQDLNAEVLRCLTIPNVRANLDFAKSKHTYYGHDAGQTNMKISKLVEPEVRYYAGSWGEMEKMLSVVKLDGEINTCANDELEGGYDTKRKLQSGTRACDRGDPSRSLEGGYDIILMSEAVYSLLSLPKLYDLIMKCLRPYGVVYLAGKKHSYGSGGGTRQFKCIVDADGLLGARLVADFTESTFNSKEIWKFFYR